MRPTPARTGTSWSVPTARSAARSRCRSTPIPARPRQSSRKACCACAWRSPRKWRRNSRRSRSGKPDAALARAGKGRGLPRPFCEPDLGLASHLGNAKNAAATDAPERHPRFTAEGSMRANRNARTGGEVLVDQLLAHGARHAFCVPGESYLAVLDAFHARDVMVTVCRQEGGAAMMAEAVGKLTGRPGICFVTRGPGATNASPGVHIAKQDSTPMILFVGQIERGMREREAFQELDYRAAFGPLAKWATEIDAVERIPE